MGSEKNTDFAMITLMIHTLLDLKSYISLHFTANLINVFLIMPTANNEFFPNRLDFIMDKECVSCNVRIEILDTINIKCMLGKIKGVVKQGTQRVIIQPERYVE